MPVIKPTLHHVTFKTTRLDEMMAWYGTVLGGTVNFKDDHNGWMTNDEANHRFAFLSVPGLEDDPDKVKHNAMHHSAFEYESSISDPIPSGRFSIQRRCIKRTRVASRSRSYSPPSALGSSYRIRSPASACRFPSTRDPQQPDERLSDCNPKRERLVARVIKLEVRL